MSGNQVMRQKNQNKQNKRRQLRPAVPRNSWIQWPGGKENSQKIYYILQSGPSKVSYAVSFYRSQNVLCRSKFFEPAQKFDCIDCTKPLQKLLSRQKHQPYWMQIIFLSVTKCFLLAQYVNKFMVRHKKFGPEQNILGPLKGHSISFGRL